MEQGYEKVCALKGGWKEWQDAGFPIQKKESAPE
jgi:3-mercaptopyruvate sulfurtransferase SseA